MLKHHAPIETSCLLKCGWYTQNTEMLIYSMLKRRDIYTRSNLELCYHTQSPG